ncbi:MAG: hypothetical protein HQK89_05015 [Nitrospirae bacterium]|nr:hypothetical protein [Nitrospirota bacterium]
MPLIFDPMKDRLYKQGYEEGFAKAKLKGELEAMRGGLLVGIKLVVEFIYGEYGDRGLSLIDKISAIRDMSKLELVVEFIRKSATVEDMENLHRILSI